MSHVSAAAADTLIDDEDSIIETFMKESGVVETVIPAADLVVDVTAQAKP